MHAKSKSLQGVLHETHEYVLIASHPQMAKVSYMADTCSSKSSKTSHEMLFALNSHTHTLSRGRNSLSLLQANMADIT